MNAKPRRRWYQFSLRTFFALVTLTCIGVGYWVHWSKDWIRQRHEALQTIAMDMSGPGYSYASSTPIDGPKAPWSLWLFGESGIRIMQCESPHFEQVQRLFPEARVIPYDR
jgi:hypothetical protein